ncbi:MAG: nucleoside triphosphate pyrophosphohydrolase [Clostridia bacterium]|nr:nucleoside triphosphate pyrophosphohydrolase [Clostridia bacterium]
MSDANINIAEEYLRFTDAGDTEEAAIRRLMDIITILRKECPWDRVQTHESLRGCLLEEAYEAAEAIDNADIPNLREELGDVLLQVVFHSSLAAEKGHFVLKDVINDECDKMIRRHPHIFLKETVKSVDKALEKWENVKRKERGNGSHRSRLEEVPRALPALLRSYKIQARAAEVGFDWDDVVPAFRKIKEETEELLEAYEKESKERISDELGDLLFSIVNVARFLDIDPERALESTSAKFVRRFGYIEESAAAKGRRLEDMTLDEMDELWDEAKHLNK